MTTRLDTIATRQSKTRVRDALFAACIALATTVSVVTVTTATRAANAHSVPVAQR